MSAGVCLAAWYCSGLLCLCQIQECIQSADSLPPVLYIRFGLRHAVFKSRNPRFVLCKLRFVPFKFSRLPDLLPGKQIFPSYPLFKLGVSSCLEFTEFPVSLLLFGFLPCLLLPDAVKLSLPLFFSAFTDQRADGIKACK